MRSGDADIALAVGAEKMFCTDKAQDVRVFDGAWDVQTVEANQRNLLAHGRGRRSARGHHVARRRTACSWTSTPRSAASTCASSAPRSASSRPCRPRTTATRCTTRWRSTATPTPSSEVLAAPPITYPLTLPMCAPISDGAAAAIVCSEAGAGRAWPTGGAQSACWPRWSAPAATRGPTTSTSTWHGQGRRRLAYERAGVGAAGHLAWPRCTTPPRSARSCRPRTWASANSAPAARWPRAARPRSAAASRSTPRAGWSPRATRSAPPASASCTNS